MPTTRKTVTIDGQYAKRLAKQRGFNQTSIAKMLDMPRPGTVGDWFRNHHCNVDKLIPLADLLGVDAELLQHGPKPIDGDVLEACGVALNRRLRTAHRNVPDGEYFVVLKLLYNNMAKTGEEPGNDEIDNLLELALRVVDRKD